MGVLGSCAVVEREGGRREDMLVVGRRKEGRDSGQREANVKALLGRLRFRFSLWIKTSWLKVRI